MLSTSDARKLRVYVRDARGALKRYGRVHATVFHPTELRVVGFAIKRPDALLMVKRKDRFAAIDRTESVDGGICVMDAPDSWDHEACRRLGVEYDSCVIWEHMPVRTVSGEELGTVSNVTFDEGDYAVAALDISSSGANRMLLGNSLIPSSKIIGYGDGAILVQDLEEEIEETGGMAARAGEVWANAKNAASRGAERAGDAINDGAYRAGEAMGAIREKANKVGEEHRARKREAEERGEYTGVDKAANLLGRQLGRASGMFKGFKDEFDRASRDE